MDPQTVDYAIMEPNGQISVIQGEGASAASVGMLRLLISDGRVKPENLYAIGKDAAWLEGVLNRKGLRPREVFMLLSDGKMIRLYPKGDPRKKIGKGSP
jgi:uncharacterized membrane protein YcaP (DUF421 family)